MPQRILIDNSAHELPWLLSTRAGQTLLKSLYDAKRHPFCNCTGGEGVKMYVARRGSHFYVARMPGSGSLHAPDCASVEDVNYLTGFTAYAPEAVQQITKAGHALGKTASLLSDSDELMPATRALLARHGYSTRPAVIQAVQNGLLHAGCFFGMGEKRFLEIQKWCE